ncbi:plant intracellular Ras-group-related LRR protein 1 [Ananas comosus]|uniref:Plant intracellular Ras-group-related LRR protein 1 n=1 Tax=Ananas comosus TaxID=4615 RepID=A0A199W950_ANACO|nr:plant intracellular Ras-group-related LRR protein 1 [Ananas comosus]XP_020103053.1 plant intracellular Ras-group-related LRR protein 1 [Ananas comosus]XP_020103054.1 plant intracellular Ras-group-related LRR protein 1 [Ananas comosus]XP_020103055.1 plant intracellular Ras-group-related LRR protein 1 [Ananas comosus]XP_020103056.1 plant intracellular Ras-group-related LRR protein 1 [Ananas comosus]OAY85758.1 Plant intracellular Ras-group-related LRR protein 1 [Ananas comosus]
MEGKRRLTIKTSEDMEKDKEKEMAKKLDLSGMSLDSLPNPSINLGLITKVDLSNNNLESIPESLTARLLNVVMLDVHSNQLKSLPNSIGCLSKLKVLNVSGNLLETLPKTIEDCRALEELNANFNKLIKLPDTMGFELTNLKKLSVNSNKLAFLPYSTSHMTALRVLDARLNCLHSLPDGLENLVRLETLNVSQNFQFLQSLPYAIGLLISLVDLDISYNRISVLPNSMGCLCKLRKLQAEGNPLVCPPMEVVEQSVEAVREYLSARMNGTATYPTPVKGGSWFRKLVKCGTVSGGMIPSSLGLREEHDGLLMPDYHPIDGLASPRYSGTFSPRRLFSPRRNSLRK